MQVSVQGTRLWFNVDGCALVGEGATVVQRPTVLLAYGGPGSYAHSYFKPYFSHLSAQAQVVYVDRRGHGRSLRHDPDRWSFEVCADDKQAFCDDVGIERPVVLGH